MKTPCYHTRQPCSCPLSHCSVRLKSVFRFMSYHFEPIYLPLTVAIFISTHCNVWKKLLVSCRSLHGLNVRKLQHAYNYGEHLFAFTKVCKEHFTAKQSYLVLLICVNPCKQLYLMSLYLYIRNEMSTLNILMSYLLKQYAVTAMVT